MSNPLVTVIIPTYNREKLIIRAINSIIAQTYTNWEIRIIDDASTDNTEQIIKGLNNPKIIYKRLSQNKGQSYARNIAINEAQGEYIGFLDSDDEWLPEKLELQIMKFSEGNEKLGAVYGYAHIIDEVDNVDYYTDNGNLRGNIYSQLLQGYCPATPTMFLIKKRVLQEVGGFDQFLPTFVDLDLWLRIGKNYEFDFVDKPLINKYEHEGAQIAKEVSPRINGMKLFMGKWEKEMQRVGGKRNVLMFKQWKFSSLAKATLSKPNQSVRKNAKTLIALLLSVRVCNLKLYSKAVIALVLGQKYNELIGGKNKK